MWGMLDVLSCARIGRPFIKRAQAPLALRALTALRPLHRLPISLRMRSEHGAEPRYELLLRAFRVFRWLERRRAE